MVLESTAGLQVVLIAHKPDQKLDQKEWATTEPHEPYRLAG
jgi:hypothetical protein